MTASIRAPRAYIRILVYACVLSSAPSLEADSTQQALAHRLNTCEAELTMLKGSIATQEQARESMEREVASLLKATREALHEQGERGSRKQKAFDASLEKFTHDLKQLKAHSNELTQSVNDLSKNIQEIKESSKRHGTAIQELEQAMRALTLALGGGGQAKGKASYRVKNGDSLEKIARKHGMTVPELKDLNNLKSQTIRPGQELAVR